MKVFNKAILLATAGITAGTWQAMASDAPLWLRHPSISPDGTTLVFSYGGDLYTVPKDGGKARQLTTDAAYDAYPVWSPDGKSIAFASARHGSMDVFVIPASGGTATRLTTNSAQEYPRTWADNNTVIFSAALQPGQQASQGQFMPQTYIVRTDGSRPQLFYSLTMPALNVAPDGRTVYQDKKGFENEFRKHERSSGTSDIWLIDGGKFTKLTDFNGHDLNPVWVGNQIAYISEEDGTLNVWKMNPDGTGKSQLTTFTGHPVRNLSAAADGTLAFAWNGELYTMSGSKEPQKVAVEIVTDNYNADLDKSVRTSGASQMSVSPDGEQVAFVLRGDVYVTSVKYKTTKRITNTTSQERITGFSPDGRSLVYDSDRDGQWKIFKATIDSKDEKTFPYAGRITETLLYQTDKAAQQPSFSPDGKKVAFLEDRTTLKVIDLESGKVHTALDGKYNYSYTDGDVYYTWSPDSRWFLTSYIGTGGWNNQDIALVSADGKTVIDLTESGYTDANPRWAMGGKAVTFETSKYGMRNHGSWGEQTDVMIMFLDAVAWDEFNLTAEEAEMAKKSSKDNNNDDKSKKDKESKEKKPEIQPLVFDTDNRYYRTARLTRSSSYVGDYFLSKDGTKLFYTTPVPEGGSNLMEIDLKKGSVKVLTKGLNGGFETDAKAENLYALTSTGIKKISLADGKETPVEFEAEYDRHPAAERGYIYEHMLAEVRDKFYDKDLHGVDWTMYGDNYRRFLPYINNNYDFADLLSEILGELNASHTGGRYYAPGAKMSTANLGAFYDTEYTGDGLRVTEVLPQGPLATKKANVKPGEIILAIDDVTITPVTDINPLLEGKAGKKLRVDIIRNNGAVETITIKPQSQGQLTEQLYRRWIEHNEAVVDSLSGGRLAYVHVRGMNSPSFRDVYSKLLGKFRNREAAIVDTRYNGGGWLHNDIALLLNGKEYVRYSPRGQYIGSDPFSQWTKPSVMLVSEANYSDAHGTPYVYQTLGIGDVVGAPVPGTMTAVWWETQIDPTLIFGIPQVTSLDRNGKALENQQLNPDILIYNNPDRIIEGTDQQLEGAVKALLDKLDNK